MRKKKIKKKYSCLLLRSLDFSLLKKKIYTKTLRNAAEVFCFLFVGFVLAVALCFISGLLTLQNTKNQPRQPSLFWSEATDPSNTWKALLLPDMFAQPSLSPQSQQRGGSAVAVLEKDSDGQGTSLNSVQC